MERNTALAEKVLEVIEDTFKSRLVGLFYRFLATECKDNTVSTCIACDDWRITLTAEFDKVTTWGDGKGK